jgi:pilus assembly protein Flp/PilA
MKRLMSFLRDEEGATAIEYGLIAALISVIIIAVITVVGTNLAAVFQRIADALIAALAA